MSLIDKLKSDLNAALKSMEPQKTETLRGLLASIHNEEIAMRSKSGDSSLTDADLTGVLQKEAKKRKEAIEIYGKAERTDLENKEKEELGIIESYLPPALEEEEIEKIVLRVISDGGDNFGKVMGSVMKEVAGRADSKIVAEIVKRNLGDK